MPEQAQHVSSLALLLFLQPRLCWGRGWASLPLSDCIVVTSEPYRICYATFYDADSQYGLCRFHSGFSVFVFTVFMKHLVIIIKSAKAQQSLLIQLSLIQYHMKHI